VMWAQKLSAFGHNGDYITLRYYAALVITTGRPTYPVLF